MFRGPPPQGGPPGPMGGDGNSMYPPNQHGGRGGPPGPNYGGPMMGGPPQPFQPMRGRGGMMGGRGRGMPMGRGMGMGPRGGRGGQMLNPNVAAARAAANKVMGLDPLTVWVGKIPPTLKNAIVLKLLRACGRVTNWKRATGHEGEEKAFGFCDFADEEGVIHCQEVLNGFDVGDGAALMVKVGAKVQPRIDEYKKRAGNTFEDKDGKLNALLRTIMMDVGDEVPQQAAVVRRARSVKIEEMPDYFDDQKKTVVSKEIGVFRELQNKRTREKEEQRKRELQRREEQRVQKRIRQREERERQRNDRHRDMSRWAKLDSFDERDFRRKEREWEDHEYERTRQSEKRADDEERARKRRTERAEEQEVDEDRASRRYRDLRKREREREEEDDRRDRAREVEENEVRQPAVDAADDEGVADNDNDFDNDETAVSPHPVPAADARGDDDQRTTRSPSPAADRPVGFSLGGARATSNPESAAAMFAAEVAAEEAEPERKRRKLIYLEPASRDPKTVIESIPTDKQGVFEYDIVWSRIAEHRIVQEKMKPWVEKKIVEFLGEAETTLIDFIVEKLQLRGTPDDILENLSFVLDQEAEVFVVKLWRKLIFEMLMVGGE
eukprot:TRINITY_DN1261_c2_g1_i1.p1 TRINITY_DN1261_c2_g1~~TRINITY_DN1261_c2_g1_i1.p1  ORF type:complete len:609 (-),score=208.52 TRINITY_DN1261_c2_g1_i1:137-1963(-)